VYQAWCTRCVSNEQSDLAVLRELADGIDQGVAPCVVETALEFHMIRVELIIKLEKLQCLPGADCARAQHPIDRDVLLSEVVTDELRVVFTVRGEPSLAVLAAGAYILGLCMAKYEQGASLAHSRSLRRSSRTESPARSMSKARSRSF